MIKSTLSVVVLVVFGFLFGACNNLSDDISDDVILPEKRETKFQQCYHEDDLAKGKCDAVLVSIFGQAIFDRSIHINSSESMMNCTIDSTIVLVPFGDTNHCIPNSYDLLYFIEQDDETIFSFRMVAGKDMQFEAVSTIVEDQLNGYRSLLDGEFNINYSEAKVIAKSNGVDFGESTLELVKDETTGKTDYHWEAELEYDHNSVALLLIDVMTGKTSKEVLTIGEIQ